MLNTYLVVGMEKLYSGAYRPIRQENLRGKYSEEDTKGFALGSQGRFPPGSGSKLGFEGKIEEEAGHWQNWRG